MKINRPLNTRSYCNKIGNDLRGLKSNVPGFSNQYSYIDPLTGEAVYSDEPPMDILYDLIAGLADRTITSHRHRILPS